MLHMLYQTKNLPNDVASLVLGNVAELRPRKGVVKVVLHEIVLWQTQQVAVLHVHQVIWHGRTHIHGSGKASKKLNQANENNWKQNKSFFYQARHTEQSEHKLVPTDV